MTSYDYIVVGGGTAGCVVATRLSEDREVSVLLLEAGGDERRPDVEDPDSWDDLLDTDADWGYRTVAQHATGRAYPAPRGRVLGGSGSINNLVHLRGHQSDFDEWASLGAHGWDYQGVLPYFKRSEDVPQGDPRFRGRSGPLHPQVVGEPHPIGTAFIRGAISAGYREVKDFNAGDMIGVGRPETLIRDGRRESTATAYLRPAMNRPNLTVLLGARALTLIVRDARCVGVDYLLDGARRSASAGEVILCAGAVGSPQQLLLAGIGPAAELAALGIDPVCDLPGVGRNLQDHILLAGIRYQAGRPLAPAGMEGAMVCARSAGADSAPDLQVSAMTLDYHLDWQQPSPNSFTFAIGHMRPHSRGTVRIAYSDPLAAPRIDPAYISERADLDKLIEGIEMTDEIVRSGTFDQWAGRSDTTALLALDQRELEHAVADAISSYFHLAGTCRAGVDDDAVVDPELRVRGVAGLRVADTSMMPTIVSSNTNAAAVMIGEKAADLIRGQSLRAVDEPAASAESRPERSARSSVGSNLLGRCHAW